MDTEKFLIMVNQVDRTKEIITYENLKSTVRIFYEEFSKEYKKAYVQIYDNPVVTKLTDDIAVFRNGFPFNNVKFVQDFGPKMRVYFEEGSSRVYDRQSIELKTYGTEHPDARRTVDYWREISKHAKMNNNQGENGDFLSKEFAKLANIDPDSALSHYLHGNSITNEGLANDSSIFPFRYNLSQRSALHQALGSKISIIEGPPGTGKTQTILNILANLAVMQGKTVAVVAGNNAAVGNVQEKLERDGYHFFLAALGSSDNKKSFFEHVPVWDVADWGSDIAEEEIEQKIVGLDQQICRLMELEREAAVLNQQLAAYKLEQEHFEHFYAKQKVQEHGKLSFYRQTPERILEFMKDSFLAVEWEKDNGLIYKFRLFFKHGIIRFKLLQEQGYEVMLSYQRQFYDLRVEELAGQITSIEKELKAHNYKDLTDEHQKYSLKLFRHKLHKKYLNRSKVTCDQKTYKSGKYFRDFIGHYPVILSTTHSLRNCIPTGYLFDYCIIDESSQVDLLTGALALSCCKQAIIVGDTKQLPQIVDEKIKEKLGDKYVDIPPAYDYFQHNILSSLLALYGDFIPKVLLREHYRCHPKIIEFCNRKYYEEGLITFTKGEETDTPLMIYTTAEGNHMRDGRKGKFNQRELDVIEQEVIRGLTEAAVSHSDIGVVTPYRNQADKASAQFEQLGSDTIHKYQGREKPVMILSTVLDRTKFGKMGMKFVNDPCKINVAVSRAQNRFVLVTDQAAFRKYGNQISDLMRYMEYSTLDPNIVESEVISIFDLLYQEYSDKLRSFRERVDQQKSSRHKSENIMHTLLEDLLRESRYQDFKLGNQVLLMNLFPNHDKLDEIERQFVRHRASVDFVIYHKFDNSPALAIEVDGYTFHENNPAQLERDKKKEGIFLKFGLDLQRFPTTGSGEEDRLRGLLDQHLSAKLEDD